MTDSMVSSIAHAPTHPPEHNQPAAIPGFAWRAVTAIAVAYFSLLLALSPGYGYYKDELYFRLLGSHPAWGYVDQPPLTPLLAKGATWLFGDTLVGIRVPAAASAAVLLVLVALLVRELGGRAGAQVLAATTVATGSYVMVIGHELMTNTVDTPLWTAAILFAVRALRRQEPRWWLAVGAIIGVATYNKSLVVVLAFGLACGLLVAGGRSVLTSRWLWLGAAIAIALAVPNLLFQAMHDWPQAAMASALSDDRGDQMRGLFVPMQLIQFGPLVAPFIVLGWWRLWRERNIRALAIAYLAAAGLVLLTGGRFDYTAGLLIALIAAGSVVTHEWLTGRRWRKHLVVAGLTLNALYCSVVNLPLLPATVLAQTPIPALNEVIGDQVGWPQLAGQVGTAVHALPGEDRANSVVLADSIGTAGALDKWSQKYDLPNIYSGHNQLFEYGPPPATADVAVAVGISPDVLNAQFDRCVRVGVVDNGLDVVNERQGKPVLTCHGLKQPWSAGWPRFRHYG